MLLMRCCHCLTLHSIFKYIYTLMIHILENCKNTKLPCTWCSKVILDYTHILSIMKLVRIQKSAWQFISEIRSRLMLLLHILFCNSKNLYVCSKDQRHLIQPMVKFPSGSVDNMVLFLLSNNKFAQHFEMRMNWSVEAGQICGFKALS